MSASQEERKTANSSEESEQITDSDGLPELVTDSDTDLENNKLPELGTGNEDNKPKPPSRRDRPPPRPHHKPRELKSRARPPARANREHVMGIIPTASDDPAYIADWGVMRVFSGAEKRETLKKQFENIQALLEDLARNGPELGADFELGVEPADFEPVAAHITAPSRKRVLVPEVLEAPEELICDDIADLDRKCCSTDSTHDTTVSAEQASAEDETGFTTPSPTKISNLSKLELFRLQCAPLKMPRQRQD